MYLKSHYTVTYTIIMNQFPPPALLSHEQMSLDALYPRSLVTVPATSTVDFPAKVSAFTAKFPASL